MPLSVALDATLWDEPTTGIGLYGRAVAGALAAQGVNVIRVGARHSGEFPRRLTRRTLHTLVELPRVLSRAGAPLYHAVANVDLPAMRVAGVAYVLTVHDLIPLTSPDTVSRPFHWQFRTWLARSLKLADHVVCVSDWTRQTLLSRHPELPESRVSMVHNGVDHVVLSPPDALTEAWLRSLELPERWVLFAGALDARKNVAVLLSALERLGRAAPTLVLAGQPWFGSDALERRVQSLRARGLDVRTLGHLAEPMLRALMARAPLFVFPSRDEGFGLPPLEAMALGTPVVVSNAASLPEVCGPAAAYVDADDVPGLARTLSRLLDDLAERRRMGEAGRLHARSFRWDQVATHLLGVYQSVVANLR